ncbi:endonuclease/exonuclease/phosphatase family protein [Actinosynnema sp. ALI-1.44]|uniref:endonuclease/exonuclease/phosphatase family protein n=1 Tax=Actinosynnema sp. ALI-1.44 TaxID=1933779 RepID=UPI001EDA517A|nr:endonuclease/exonuclease/phosphatase family protein [Actinosynnema sp. ALI-1.44]
MSVSVMTVNVGAPSLDRAQQQLRWLAARREDVLVLTETKATPGSKFLAEAFAATNHAVVFPEHAPGELGVMIVSRLHITPDPLNTQMSYLPARAAGVIVDTTTGPVRVIGAYVPSRDSSLAKTERKKTWIQHLHQALNQTASDAPLLLIGDLNVIEPTHTPSHRG